MRLLIIITILTLTTGCKSSKLPDERFAQYDYYKSFNIENNELKIELKNPLNCPLRIWMFHSDKDLQTDFNKINPIELKSKSDTLLIFSNIGSIENEVNFSSRLGSTSNEIKNIKVELPFPTGKEYRIIQGNNTNHTHNTDWSRYAVDFNLKVNDTICAATSGFVVGVIDKYKLGGEEDKWKPFGNYITIYEPNSGVFTQYVHLVQNGSLVKIGDKIESGQPIALSGKTEQRDIEHLHFNYLIPINNDNGLKSIAFEFVEGYKSEELKKNDLIKK